MNAFYTVIRYAHFYVYLLMFSQSKVFINQYISLWCVMHSDIDYSNLLKMLLTTQLAG